MRRNEIIDKEIDVLEDRIIVLQSCISDLKNKKVKEEKRNELENIAKHCDWCNSELNDKHDDDLCRYLNR